MSSSKYLPPYDAEERVAIGTDAEPTVEASGERTDPIPTPVPEVTYADFLVDEDD
ncbi:MULTISPECIES: hypothetical protein [unclassified Curtobacterium]|uniref:hypothetical protein n=1 Tax=unclassified Curtobacterium TaxID=257496 RepID=UPI001587EE74|nr:MULTISPECIES: hypothetical protein [unclassified Curtobacterium]